MSSLTLVGALENCVEVDVDWDDEDQAPRGYARMLSEPEAWCKDNLKSVPELDWEQVYDGRPFSAAPSYQFTLTFDDDADMIMFKLRWS